MIYTDFAYYCQDCPRISVETRIAEIDTGNMSGPPEEQTITEITISCSHRKICARMMHELEKRYKREQKRKESEGK